jgi:hypothetical protein
MSSPKQTERRELWRQRITRQENSGQSARAFCREQHLNEHAFYTWRKRFGSPDEPIRFALLAPNAPPAKPSQPQPKPGEPIEVILANGERLRIPADAASLRLVLNVLRGQEQQPTA